MTIRVYTTPSCPWCTVVKNYLRDRGAKFTEYDVSRDTRKFEEMVHKSRQMGVPVVDLGGKVVVGFKKEEIDRQLQKLPTAVAL